MTNHGPCTSAMVSVTFDVFRSTTEIESSNVLATKTLPPATPSAVGAAAFALGGLLGLLIGAVLLLLPHRGSRLPAVAGTAFALAGVAVFLSPGRFPGGPGGPGGFPGPGGPGGNPPPPPPPPAG